LAVFGVRQLLFTNGSACCGVLRFVLWSESDIDNQADISHVFTLLRDGSALLWGSIFAYKNKPPFRPISTFTSYALYLQGVTALLDICSSWIVGQVLLAVSRQTRLGRLKILCYLILNA
jgi:hypothetical protein